MAEETFNKLNLHEDAKAGLFSLIQQTMSVSTGLFFILVVTGGAPSGFILIFGFCIGITFVAWSEQKRVSNLKRSYSSIAREEDKNRDIRAEEKLKINLRVEEDDSTQNSSQEEFLPKTFIRTFEGINQLQIKDKVDKWGIDEFIDRCALSATGSGATGFGGFSTMTFGVSSDVLNVIEKQFRVTLGVMYYKKGIYKISFSELMMIVGASVGVEVGATLTKSVKVSIANTILVRLSALKAQKVIPFLGATVSGYNYYIFVKNIGEAVKCIDMNAFTFQSEESVNGSEEQ